MARRIDPREDDGVILLITLGFLAFFGLVAVALLGQGGAGIKSSSAVSGLGKKVYSADGAIEVGIEALRTDATLCPDLASGQMPIATAVTVDADTPPVTLICRTTNAGTAGGFHGYGVVTTSSASDSLQTQSGSGKTVSAPVYNSGGVSGSKSVDVIGANYYQASATCTASATATPSPPYRKICGATAPALDAVLPAAPAAINPPPDTTAKPGCTVFSPGVYTTAPALGDNNYFKSGVYYFSYAGDWNIHKTSLVGGTSGGATSELLLPCYNELSINGSGVEFVMLGSSTISLSNSAKVELYARQPAVTDGTAGISLFVSGSRSGPVLTQSNGNPQIVVHGLVYSPDAEVFTNATGSVSFWLLNGIVAKKFLLQSTGDALKVATSGTASGRRVLMTATAPGAAGERVVTATAVLDIASDAVHTITVVARRSQ